MSHLVVQDQQRIAGAALDELDLDAGNFDHFFGKHGGCSGHGNSLIVRGCAPVQQAGGVVRGSGLIVRGAGVVVKDGGSAPGRDAYQRLNKWSAISTAMGAPLGFPAAKNSSNIGVFFELCSVLRVGATRVKIERKRSS